MRCVTAWSTSAEHWWARSPSSVEKCWSQPRGRSAPKRTFRSTTAARSRQAGGERAGVCNVGSYRSRRYPRLPRQASASSGRTTAIGTPLVLGIRAGVSGSATIVELLLFTARIDSSMRQPAALSRPVGCRGTAHVSPLARRLLPGTFARRKPDPQRRLLSPGLLAAGPRRVITRTLRSCSLFSRAESSTTEPPP